MDELLSALNPDPKAVVIEVSTKLALEWADENRPIELEDLLGAKSRISDCFSGVLSNEALATSVKVSQIKSVSRISHYWYAQNKSVNLDQLIEAIHTVEKKSR